MSEGSNINLGVVGLPKVEKKKIQVVDFDLVRKIIEDPTKCSLRDRCIMIVFAISACRLGELQSIKVYEVNHAEHNILLHDHKTSKDKTAPIPGYYYPILKEYISMRASWLKDNNYTTDALFISSRGTALTEDGIRQILYRIARVYRIDRPEEGKRIKHVLHPHAMRHTATTRLMEVIGNPEEVMTITGHSTSSMLDHYSHARDEVIKEKMENFKY
jgi:integrase/recombinase XerD